MTGWRHRLKTGALAFPSAFTLALALAAVASVQTWFVFGPHADRPAAAPPPGYLQAKGDALFSASFKKLGANNVDLQALRGKPVVAYFWPSWCVECATEAKTLQLLQDQHHVNGLVVLGFGVDQADRIERFARVNAIGFPVFVGGQASVDLSKKLGNLREAMPFVVAIDRQGQAVASHLGKFDSHTAQDMAAAALR